MAKTFKVEELKNIVNDLLKAETSPEERFGAITVLQSVLFSTKNYNGFRYLEQKEVPQGHNPGIWCFDGTMDEKFKDTDESRRHYF